MERKKDAEGALGGLRPAACLNKATRGQTGGDDMTAPHLWLAIGLGGAIGAMARHGVGVVALRALGPNFPWGTLTVNVAGGFAMGLFIAWLTAREPQSALLRSFVVTGMLGGFTTFSAFALEAVTLGRDRSLAAAALYVGVSVFLSIGALLAGLQAGRAFS